MEIKNVFVINVGTMGNGIAQVAAEAGYKVIIEDINEDFIKGGLDSIEKSLSRKVKKGARMKILFLTVLKQVQITTDINSAKDADLVMQV